VVFVEHRRRQIEELARLATRPPVGDKATASGADRSQKVRIDSARKFRRHFLEEYRRIKPGSELYPQLDGCPGTIPIDAAKISDQPSPALI
jgi:hypothetical protein